MKNQTEYYINVYHWRDLPQGLKKVQTFEHEAASTIEEAIAERDDQLSLFPENLTYYFTISHDGQIDLDEEMENIEAGYDCDDVGDPAREQMECIIASSLRGSYA